MILPAISIRQPWAHRILHMAKDVENRTWPCPRQYIGQRVLIHAGLSTDGNVQDCTPEQQKALLRAICADTRPRHLVEGMVPLPEGNAHKGGIVGIVTITGCVQDCASPWAEPGVFHWLLAEAKPLPFHPCKGRLGFFQVDYPHEVPA